MAPMILSIFLSSLVGSDGAGSIDARLLVDTIESLQQPVDDFRCEFEGNTRRFGQLAECTKVGADGLYGSFSGIFIWKRGGDTYSESLRRMVDGRIMRENLVVRMQEQLAEEYARLNDAPLGRAVIKNPKEATSWRQGCLGFIFLIDKIKRDVADQDLEVAVSDDQIEGRPLKVLSVELKGLPGCLILRYWIDLRRNGHVVRQESYQPGKVMVSRLDIKLARFKVGDAEVWMPVSGDLVGYAAIVDKKPVVTKEPTVRDTIYVVGGTMEFNKHPGREVFAINYKPGTPVSDNLRKLVYEFGRQKIGLKPTKADTERMLNDQIAKAEEQKKELVVAPQSEGFDWTLWLGWAFAAAVVISSGALWMQRRRR